MNEKDMEIQETRFEKLNIRIKRNYASIVPDNKNIRIKSKRQER